MNLNSIWSALDESFDLLGNYGYPAMDKAAEEFALDPDYFTWLAAVWLFGLETITTEKYMRMFPYGLASVNEGRFTSAVQKGYLASDGKGGYTHTEDGLTIAKKLWRAAGDSLADLNPIPDEHLQRLFSYLIRIADASLAAPEPPPHFYISRKLANYGQYGTKCPIEDFVVHFGVLAAYRDDSHMAAWRIHNIVGNHWEVFSEVWGGRNSTLDKIFEERSYRGITRDEYASILQELVERGWIQQNGDAYQPTAEGKRIRDEAEALTDQYFFAPWSCLNESELEELASLAGQLREGLPPVS